MARKPIHYQVTDQQREELVTMQRSLKLQKRYVNRANVVILSSQGMTIDQIMEQTKLSRRAVNKWRQRFKSSGIDGLVDAPRKGKPPVITQEKKILVIQKSCSKPEGGYNEAVSKGIDSLFFVDFIRTPIRGHFLIFNPPEDKSTFDTSSQ